VLSLHTAEVQFYCDDRPAAQADNRAVRRLSLR
jgi:hypothetical protein